MPQGWFNMWQTGAGISFERRCATQRCLHSSSVLFFFPGEWLSATATKQKQRRVLNGSETASQLLQRQPWPTGAAEPQCCHQICWINPAACIGGGQAECGGSCDLTRMTWRGVVAAALLRRSQVRAWGKPMSVGRLPSSAHRWTYLDLIFMY